MITYPLLKPKPLALPHCNGKTIAIVSRKTKERRKLVTFVHHELSQ